MRRFGVTKRRSCWYGGNQNALGHVVIVRFRNKAGTPQESFQEYTDDMDRCLREHENGMHEYSARFGAFDRAAWVSGVPAFDIHNGTKSKAKYDDYRQFCSQVGFDMSNPSNSFTLKRVVHLIYELHRPEHKFSNATLHLQLPVPARIIAGLPTTVMLQTHPCPWTGIPEPIIPEETKIKIEQARQVAEQRRKQRETDEKSQSIIFSTNGKFPVVPSTATDPITDSTIEPPKSMDGKLSLQPESTTNSSVPPTNVSLTSLAGANNPSIALINPPIASSDRIGAQNSLETSNSTSLSTNAAEAAITIDDAEATFHRAIRTAASDFASRARQSKPEEVRRLQIEIYQQRETLRAQDVEKKSLQTRYNFVFEENKALQTLNRELHVQLTEQKNNQGLAAEISKLQTEIKGLHERPSNSSASIGSAGECEMKDILKQLFAPFMEVEKVSHIPNQMDFELTSLDRSMTIYIDVKNHQHDKILPAKDADKFYTDIDIIKPSPTVTILFSNPTARSPGKLMRRGDTRAYEIGNWNTPY